MFMDALAKLSYLSFYFQFQYNLEPKNSLNCNWALWKYHYITGYVGQLNEMVLALDLLEIIFCF